MWKCGVRVDTVRIRFDSIYCIAQDIITYGFSGAAVLIRLGSVQTPTQLNED